MSLARSSLFFALGTFLSRLSGLLRDMVVTHLLGASALNDAFIIAQRIPNLLRDMLAEGALGSSFTKVFTSLKEDDSKSAEILLFQMLYFVIILTSFLVSLGVIFTPQLVRLMNLGVDGSYSLDSNAIGLTRLLFPSLSLTVIGAIAMGALYQKGKFFFNAVVPALANVGVILGGFYFGDWIVKLGFLADQDETVRSVFGLALGTLVGFFFQAALSIWATREALFRVKRSLVMRWPWSPDIKRVIVLMAPAAIAGSAGPINSLVNTNFATSVGQGAVTWLNYAFRLVQLPVGIFGVAVGVYALPALTRAVTRAGRSVDINVSKELQDCFLFVLWLLTPCMIFTLLFNKVIIDLIFGHGRYLEADVIATADCLFLYGLSIVSYGLIKVLTSFYYAIDKTSFAMKVSLSGILANFVFNFLLVSHLKHMGLALSSSLTLTMNALFLFFGTWKLGVVWEWKYLFRNLFSLILAGASFYFLSTFLCEVYLTNGSLILRELISSSNLASSSVLLKKASDVVQLLIGFFILVTCFGGMAYIRRAYKVS